MLVKSNLILISLKYDINPFNQFLILQILMQTVP
jgi:hypothetical protein